ncbi:MAG: MBL fold metallo-hydrolase [Candidatus Aminicenantes bacterium]|nr:MBL fold metallo-hydrolase [Candidatus Aminicenantes bacterium]
MGGSAREPVSSGRTLRFTILYDNYLHKKGTQSDWGFSCLIEGPEKTILFDTGTNPRILMHNVEALGVDLTRVDQIVLSHIHGDHTGGLPAVLEKNHEVTVFFPVSFPSSFKAGVERAGAKAQAVDQPVEICPQVHLTGELGDRIKEQSLLIDTPSGLIVVTGCSHPGIVNILRRCREIVDKPIRLVFGGFHLRDASEAEMREIIAAFKSLKVEKCGATHCTGDAQIAMFKEAFGENSVSMGTGRVIEIPE